MRVNLVRNALLVSFAMVFAVTGQTLTYSLLPAGTTAPAPRFDGAIAYDLPGRQIFLFGGQDSFPRNDLWLYSLDRRQWAPDLVRTELGTQATSFCFGTAGTWIVRMKRSYFS